MEERTCEINAKRRAAAKSRIDRFDESLSPNILQARPSGVADKGQGNQVVAERYSNRRTRTGFEQAGV